MKEARCERQDLGGKMEEIKFVYPDSYWEWQKIKSV